MRKIESFLKNKNKEENSLENQGWAPRALIRKWKWLSPEIALIQIYNCEHLEDKIK